MARLAEDDLVKTVKRTKLVKRMLHAWNRALRFLDRSKHLAETTRKLLSMQGCDGPGFVLTDHENIRASPWIGWVVFGYRSSGY